MVGVGFGGIREVSFVEFGGVGILDGIVNLFVYWKEVVGPKRSSSQNEKRQTSSMLMRADFLGDQGEIMVQTKVELNSLGR